MLWGRRERAELAMIVFLPLDEDAGEELRSRTESRIPDTMSFPTLELLLPIKLSIEKDLLLETAVGDAVLRFVVWEEGVRVWGRWFGKRASVVGDSDPPKSRPRLLSPPPPPLRLESGE